MSEDTPRRRIDWDGEGIDPQVNRILMRGNLLRRALVPATFGLVGLALVGALAAGPLTRHLMATDDDAVQAASVAEEAADVDVAAERTAEPAPVEIAAKAATAARIAGAQQSVGLAANDPRWSADALTVDESKLAELKKAVDETVAAAEIAGAMESDEVLYTSTIPAHATGFAPTGAARERNAFDAALSGASAEEEEAEPEVASNLQPATTAQYVNMRAGPADDADVITVVPANAAIEAETDCRWCEVSYNGQKGYIFQSFITR